MKDHDVFWKLEALSDRQLLERVGSMLGSSRRVMAELIAHLAEVEERRLHLAAACSSMFAYCLKLGMTEDEAYRRIEVARLARRYPAIFPMLASGQLSISVVALLKHHLSEDNHIELLAAVTRKSVGQARELIAARFPRPDVASSVRKVPERRTLGQPLLAISSPTEPCAGQTAPRFTSSVTSSMEVPAHPEAAEVASRAVSMGSAPAFKAPPGTGPTLPAHSERIRPPPPPSRIEPLSARRYKIQFTARAELAHKIQLAKDLMRHSHPDGELGPIVERALDLLIESLMQRRFGKSKKASPRRTSARARHAHPEQRGDAMGDRSTTPDTAEPTTTTTLDSVDVHVEHDAELEQASTSPYIPRSTRRTVVERDGLGCSWVDEHGARCGSGSWLEYDHRHPRAKGGGGEPDNVRLLCRSHNRFAAEREYGRRHVERAVAQRRGQSSRPPPPAI
jgi:5-methylcytosine-specific restriction endonuclease McrA